VFETQFFCQTKPCTILHTGMCTLIIQDRIITLGNGRENSYVGVYPELKIKDELELKIPASFTSVSSVYAEFPESKRNHRTILVKATLIDSIGNILK